MTDTIKNLPDIEVQDRLLDNVSAISVLPKISKKLNVLVAEDCPDTRALLHHLLQSIGASVTLVSNGARCVHSAMTAMSKNKPFDLILVDIRMPVMNGPLAVRTLRERGYKGPIVAITGSPTLTDKAESTFVGCDHFLAKYSLVDTIIPTLKEILKIA